MPKQVTLSSSSNLSLIRIGDYYQVKIELDGVHYVHHFSFETIRAANELSLKILATKKIDLKYWKQIEYHNHSSENFLVHHHRKSKAHIWTGLDTLCKMWSTGGMGDGYHLFDHNLGRAICLMCHNQLID